jgi:ABC-2 type transport system permease protein
MSWLLCYGFFVSVVSGMAVIQDEQWRMGELLASTSLREGEYIWGKFTAVLCACAAILFLHLAAMFFFNHVVPNSEAHEIRGPLLAVN